MYDVFNTCMYYNRYVLTACWSLLRLRGTRTDSCWAVRTGRWRENSLIPRYPKDWQCRDGPVGSSDSSRRPNWRSL